MSVTVTLETVTTVMETTKKCCLVILHLLSISNLPTELLKLQVKKKSKELPHQEQSQLTFLSEG